MLDDDARPGRRAARAARDAGATSAQIRDAYQKLEAMTFAIAEKMYGGQQENPS